MQFLYSLAAADTILTDTEPNGLSATPGVLAPLEATRYGYKELRQQ